MANYSTREYFDKNEPAEEHEEIAKDFFESEIYKSKLRLTIFSFNLTETEHKESCHRS